MDPAETDPAVLQVALQHAESLLAAKDRELAAKEETIGLLRAKVRELERTPREDFDFLAALKGEDAAKARPKTHAPRPPVKQEAEKAPQSAWARFYRWFREA